MPWVRANEVSCGSLYALGSPSKQLSQPARGCFWPLVNPWHPWHTHSASQHWQLTAQEGDNQGIHAIPGRKKIEHLPTPALYCWFREGSLPRAAVPCRWTEFPAPQRRVLSLGPTADGTSNLWEGAPCLQVHPSAANWTSRVCNRAQSAAFCNNSPGCHV